MAKHCATTCAGHRAEAPPRSSWPRNFAVDVGKEVQFHPQPIAMADCGSVLHPFEMGVIVVIGRLDSWVGARFPECKDSPLNPYDMRCAIFTNADA